MSRWQLGQMLHQLRDQAEVVMPMFFRPAKDVKRICRPVHPRFPFGLPGNAENRYHP
jgi:hypothetical protein